MFKTAKKFHDMGFSILWLQKKSKRPIETKWTTGPRKTWKELARQYQPGFNVGTRLGATSEIKGKYLSVIDVDIKSEDPKHEREAYAKVKELLGDTNRPQVLSGRGNGSLHIYGTTKNPAQTRRLGQSREVVRVRMPSSDRPSRRELSTLSQSELKAGWRLRPAWEISIMGEGSQVVLPYSIHPDTGNAYKWDDLALEPEIKNMVEFPESVSKANKENTKDSEENEPQTEIEFIEVDLLRSKLPDHTVDAIISGTDVEDRSATMLSVAMQMLRKGFDDNEILSVLTDKDNYLGAAAFEHAKTSKRIRAAKWVRDFTLKKAKKKIDLRSEFEGTVEILPLNELEAKEQFEEIEAELDWRDDIERTKGFGSSPKNTLKNCSLILRKAIGENLFIRNEFSGRDYYGIETPWGGKKGRELTDDDSVMIKDWLAGVFQFEPSSDKIFESMILIAVKNKFHPVRDYLEALKWDGKYRIRTWLKDIMKAEGPTEYLESVSELILLAMVARVEQPGIKFDHMLILEGKQGIGKSSIPRILSEPWFNETFPDIRDKDAMLNLVGSWVNEISELAILKRADSESYKAFFTRQIDRVRAPYGKRHHDIPRQCIFIGTTNDSAYLKDKTGNRRFWPVKLKKQSEDEITENLANLRAIKDQLLAEAKHVWDCFQPDLMLKGKAKLQAENVQASKVQEDVQDAIESKLQKYIDGIKAGDRGMDLSEFKLANLFDKGVGPLEDMKLDNSNMQLAGRALVKMGFENRHTKQGNFWQQKEGEEDRI